MILEGELAVLLFDDQGGVTRQVELAVADRGLPFVLWLDASVWRMSVCRDEPLVFYETMQGPFRRDAVKQWALWSPAAHAPAGIAPHLARLGVG